MQKIYFVKVQHKRLTKQKLNGFRYLLLFFRQKAVIIGEPQIYCRLFLVPH